MKREIAALFIDSTEVVSNDAAGVRVAPTEFRLLKAGLNRSTKGNFVFDEEAAASVMDAWVSSGLAMMGDYEHQSLYKDPPIEAPASCTGCRLVIRNGELWAEDAKWAPRAASMLSAGEYRYFSPAFYFDPDSGRVLELINFALTNVPALRAITPLVAATDDHKEKHMDEEAKKQIAALTAKVESREAEIATLKATKDAAGELAALTSVKDGFLAALGVKSPAEGLGKIEALKTSAAKVAELTAELGKLEQAGLVAKLDGILDAASKGDKPRITPAKKADLRAKALNAAGEVVAERLEFLSGLLDGLEPLNIKTTTSEDAAKPTKEAAQLASIPTDTHKFLEHVGQKPEDVALFQANPGKWMAEQMAKRQALTGGVVRVPVAQ